MNVLTRSLGILSLSLGLAACGSDDDDGPAPTPNPTPEPEVNTVVDVALDNGNFETLVTALQATGLDETLDDPEGSFTVFAPTDDAFALLGEDTINNLLADTDTLSDILLYHVISGSEVDAETAIGLSGNTQEMANGDSVGLSLSGDNLLINLSMVTMTDVEADNGVIHVIDAVLMPPAEKGEPMDNIVQTAINAGNFNTLVEALQAAGLDGTLANEEETFTVFAPTDEAFDKISDEALAALIGDNEALTAVLSNHVVAGAEVDSVTAFSMNGGEAETVGGAMIPLEIADGMFMVGGALVETFDVYASNGVIHVIDTVIVGDVELPEPPQSIVDVATEAGNFETLIAALEATGLDETLGNLENDFTVFAPTDDAFSEFSQAEIDALLADTETLSNILLYHVLGGNMVVDSGTATGLAGDTVEMANGDMAALSLSGENLLVNLSQVVAADVDADNGLIHAIDKVMMPPAAEGNPTDNIVETAVAAGNFTTLVDLLVESGLDATLADESSTFTVFAPTDAAFENVPQETMDALAADPALLEEVLLTHVVAGQISSIDAYAANGTSIETVSGAMASIEIANGELQVAGSTVITADVYTTNGVIHAIDEVIIPE
ncbi:fasciclin domain-containing protein [Marinimicrobium sp. C2-29]|uniref:fasciclin domain-containing protein n=1 Tax=Marinimicrobium sp. C2-29 TaxID=3139825 RepID=UPI0031386EEC